MGWPDAYGEGAIRAGAVGEDFALGAGELVACGAGFRSLQAILRYKSASSPIK
jgi:hypothetical protein